MFKYFTQQLKPDLNKPRSKSPISFILGGIGLVVIGGLTLTSCSTDSKSTSISSDSKVADQTQKTTVVNIGHQKFDPLTLVKNKGNLEKRLKPLGVTEIKWIEFPSGPPMMEALNAGSLDIARTGDSPPIVAQAANAPFIYVGTSAPKSKSSALLVKKDSPIKEIADLKGKKVAFAKGSSAHYLIIKILESAGLEWGDITPAYLAPADARAAFENGEVDAWVIWDPFFAAVQSTGNVRIIRDSDGLVTNRDFYLSNEKFADGNAEIIAAIQAETQAVSGWAKENPQEVVDFLSPLLKIDKPILLNVTNRRTYGFENFTPGVIEEQQAIADAFFNLELIPKSINVADIVWEAPKK